MKFIKFIKNGDAGQQLSGPGFNPRYQKKKRKKKYKISGPTTDLMNQNLHFTKNSRQPVSFLMYEEYSFQLIHEIGFFLLVEESNTATQQLNMAIQSPKFQKNTLYPNPALKFVLPFHSQ